MTYLIGVDGGGSKTTALVSRQDGTILGRGTSGSSNSRAVGLENACISLEEAIRAAFADANIELKPNLVQMACFGLAGLDRPGDQVPYLAWAERLWPGMPVEFVSDARVALAAGTPDDWGIGVFCGTGSIVFGRDPQGQMARAGGWGYLLGDEGSGYDIGLTALHCITKAEDGRGSQTALTELILAEWSLGSVQDLVNYVYRPEIAQTEIAALAIWVEVAAKRGDPVANGILQEASYELASAANVVIDRLQLTGQVPCALVGGLLVHGELVSQKFLASASELGLQLSPVQRVTDPALGAIRLAWKRAKSGSKDAG